MVCYSGHGLNNKQFAIQVVWLIGSIADGLNNKLLVFSLDLRILSCQLEKIWFKFWDLIVEGFKFDFLLLLKAVKDSEQGLDYESFALFLYTSTNLTNLFRVSSISISSSK